MAKETKVPEHLRYTAEHEWVRVEGKVATLGITDYAQDALTDVVFVELPDVGESFKHGDSMGVVESTKSVSDIYAPVSGKIVEVNTALEDKPELLNDDPYGEGWFAKIEMSDPSEAGKLLDAAGYRKTIENA
ncbi:MAG TPA: glycine cleavage system protein GcvH [Candidatus Thermoplasmatota archaeon]|nr:glycine cleavage system protein GcvH [Candidatus Thermoplasmatota archaeon]